MGDDQASPAPGDQGTAQPPLAGDSEALDIPPRPKGQAPELTTGHRQQAPPVQEPLTPKTPQEWAAAVGGLRCPEAAGAIDPASGLPGGPDGRVAAAQARWLADPGRAAAHEQAEADRARRQAEADRLADLEDRSLAAVRRELSGAKS